MAGFNIKGTGIFKSPSTKLKLPTKKAAPKPQPAATPPKAAPATASKTAPLAAPPAGDTSTVRASSYLAMSAAPPAVAPAAAPAGRPDASSTDPIAVKAVLDQVSALIPGARFTDDGKTKWTVGDAQGLLTVAQGMSAQDRALLRNANIQRVATIPPKPGHEGRDNYGDMAFQAVEPGGPMTIRLADVASRSGVQKEVFAHEIGHAAMGGGRWDANMLREYSKLSNWVRPDGSLFNGYDKAHNPVNFEPGVVAKNPGTIVSDYGTEDPSEDFAEAYRVFTLNPDELMAKAPDKFLFLNAQSGRFSPAEVQAKAAAAGVDLPLTMATLRQSTLRPETLDKIGTVNGLAQAGTTGSGPGDAIAAIHAKAGDPAFIAQLKKDPRAALGDDTWNRLSSAEQKLLGNDAYIDRLAKAAASNKAAPKDAISSGDVAALKDFYNWIISNPPDNATKLSMSDEKVLGFPVYKFGATPGKSPEQARFDYFNKMLRQPQFWNRLSPEAKALMDSPNGQKGINMLANDQSMKEATKALWGGIKVKIPFFGTHYIGGNPDKKVIDHARKAVDRMGAAEVQAWHEMIKNPNQADVSKFGNAVNTMLNQGYYQTPLGPAM